MEKHEDYKLNSLNGWLQQCKKCGTVSKYDQYCKSCEHCDSGSHDVFFKCPECDAITDYGNEDCSGCKKEISDLLSAPFIELENPKEGKSKKHRLLKFLIALLVFSGLIYAAGLNIFVAIAMGILMGLFCMFL